MYKRIIKWIIGFILLGFAIGGLISAFVISSQKNNSLNQNFIINDEKIIPIFEGENLKSNPQYSLEINETKYNFQIDNFMDLTNVTTSSDNKYFKSTIDNQGLITIDILPLANGEQYPQLGEENESDLLAPYKRADKRFPILKLKADNVQIAMLIYLVITI